MLEIIAILSLGGFLLWAFRRHRKRLLSLLTLAKFSLTLALIALAFHFLSPIPHLPFLLGIAAILLGFDAMRNLFAGTIIALQRPFKVGDYIQVPPFQGQVLRIGLQTTLLLDPNTAHTAIPNKHLLTHSITNLSSHHGLYPVVIRLPIPVNIPLDAARRMAHHAAAISRYTSPLQQVDVILEDDQQHLRLRVHTFAPLLEGALRHDISTLFAEGLGLH